MKNLKTCSQIPKSPIFRSFAAALLLAAFGATSAVADVVYVTATCSNATSTTVCGSAVNPDYNLVGNLVYNDEGSYGGYTSAKAGTLDKVTVPGGRYHSNSFSNSTPDIGIVLSPSLGVTGGVYKVWHVYSSTAGNVSSNIIIGATNVEGCTILWTNTDRFQSRFGQPSPQSWQFMGFVTNNPDTSFPRIRLYYVGGMVNAGAQQRFIIEQFKFEQVIPCSAVPSVGVTGPIAPSIPTVTVTGVDPQATNVTVYQDTGSGPVQVGKLTSGVTSNNNVVPVTGLTKGARVGATQTINGIEGCKPQTGFGILVGGGANPRLRVALSLKEAPTATGPVGANGGTAANSNIHFVPCTEVLNGSCPGDGAIILYPSNDWQTVTVPGRDTVGNPANVAGTVAAGTGYNANDSVTVQVYAFRNIPSLSIPIFSKAPGQATATSAQAFTVNWTWDAVPGAEGYRLVRNVNNFGPNEYVDVTSGTSFSDSSSTWAAGVVVTPTSAQTVPSILWYPQVTTPDTIAGDWAILESIAFVNDDPTDTGPFDIYIDNLANGNNGIFQDFEAFPANLGAGFVFNQPSFSGTTSGNLLSAPNVTDFSNVAADTGTKSIHVQWQFLSPNTNSWMRFNTYSNTVSVMPNPLVNLDEPISFRILMQPVGATPPTPPTPPTISAQDWPELNWVGGHRLQTAVKVDGPYTNVPQTILGFQIGGPYTNTFLAPWTVPAWTDTTRFFRLRD